MLFLSSTITKFIFIPLRNIVVFDEFKIGYIIFRLCLHVINFFIDIKAMKKI